MACTRSKSNCGNDAAPDYERLLRVGRCALAHDVLWLTADFNCTVTDPACVTEIPDRLRDDEPASDLEARVHPGLYQRRHVQVDLRTVQGPGFGRRVEEIGRDLPVVER